MHCVSIIARRSWVLSEPRSVFETCVILSELRRASELIPCSKIKQVGGKIFDKKRQALLKEQDTLSKSES